MNNIDDILSPRRAALLGLVLIVTTLGTAHAAMSADAEGCARIERQVEEAIAQRAHSPRIDAAKMRRDKAVLACAEGHHQMGVNEFRLALRELGVKPTR